MKQRKLFEKSEYPDNHVDKSTFMINLVKNKNVRRYKYWTVVRHAVPVVQQITAVTIFLAVTMYAMQGQISERFLAFVDIAIASVGGFAANIPQLSGKLKLESATTIYLLAGTLVVLAPVMRTLTESYSDDTVTFLVMLLCSLHLMFHEYRSIPRSILSGSLGMFSLNAGMFASILVASRLSSDVFVFEILGLSTLLLVCFPLLRQFLIRESEKQNVMLAVVMVSLAFFLLLPLSTTVAVVYIASVCFIGFLAPFGLISIQAYKYKINGPWDIAELKIRRKSSS
jgi:phosphatidylinositol N-acetylglucosaminyltransferase subunit C